MKKVKILAMDKIVEESVTLLIDGQAIECFVSYCPNMIGVGETHNVELAIDYSETYQIKKIPEINTYVEKIGSGFSYFFYGVLKGRVFKTFTNLPDEDIHFNYPELDGYFVKVKVDRVNVSFM